MSLSMHGTRGTATGWEELRDGDPLQLGLLSALPRGKCRGSCSSSVGGAGGEIFWAVLLPGGWRLCPAERRDPRGVRCSAPLLPALPLPTCRPPAPAELGTALVPQRRARSCPRDTAPVPCRGLRVHGHPPHLPCIAGHRAVLSSSDPGHQNLGCPPKRSTPSGTSRHTRVSASVPTPALTPLSGTTPAGPRSYLCSVARSCPPGPGPRQWPRGGGRARAAAEPTSGGRPQGVHPPGCPRCPLLRARAGATRLSPPGGSGIVCRWDNPQGRATPGAASTLRGAKPRLCCPHAWASSLGARRGRRAGGGPVRRPRRQCRLQPGSRHLNEKLVVGEEESRLLGELLSFAQPSARRLWGGIFFTFFFLSFNFW